MTFSFVHIFKIALFGALLLPEINFALTPSTASPSQKFKAPNSSQEIVVYGLQKTQRPVIQTEINLCRCENDFETLGQRLLNTGLFKSVTVKEHSSDQSITKSLLIEEKWTTIPILKFNSGGGVNQLTAGVYDPHLFGRRIEIGAQYESIASAPSFVVWNKIPRFLNTAFFTDLQFWNTKRIRLKYLQNKNDPVLERALLQETKKLYFAVGREWNFRLRTSLLLEHRDDVFSTDFIDQSVLNKVSRQTLPESAEVFLPGVQIDWGFLETHRQSPKGLLAQASYRKGIVKGDTQSNFNLSKIDLVSHQFWKDFSWSSRYQLGFSDTNILQYWNYLGGLESIRGFVDNRFAGRRY
jgi:hypothetical protein